MDNSFFILTFALVKHKELKTMERNFLKEINQIDNDAENFIVKKMREFSIDVLEFTTPKPLVYNYDFGANEVLIAQIRIGVHSIDDVVFVTTEEDNETFIHSDEVVCGTMAYFALAVNDEIVGFYQRMNEQAKLVQKQPTYSKRFFFLPDKFNPRDLSNEEFANRAFMFGKVMSMEQYADAFNSFQLDNIHPDILLESFSFLPKAAQDPRGLRRGFP